MRVVRGGEVVALLDENNELIREETDRKNVKGTQRTLRVMMDAAQVLGLFAWFIRLCVY